MISVISRINAAVRTWYRSTSNAFKAAVTTALIAAATRCAVPILTLMDDVQRWLEGAGDPVTRDQLIATGRLVAAAGFGIVAGLINYWYRRWRAGPIYPHTPAPP